MKLKDIKGIAEKLPKKTGEVFDPDHAMWGNYDDSYYMGKGVGFDSAVEEVLNTDIDINDIVEIDVEKVTEILRPLIPQYYERYNKLNFYAKAIAKSGCIKFKEKE